MGIKDDVYEEFFDKLAEAAEVPASVVVALKAVVERGESISEEKLLGIIERGFNDDDKSKDD